MKYIVTKSEEGLEEIFVFSREINHNIMAEAVFALRDSGHGNWKRIRRKPIAAGFVEGGRCCGRSESLNLGSRPEDTRLLVNGATPPAAAAEKEIGPPCPECSGTSTIGDDTGILCFDCEHSFIYEDPAAAP